MTTSNAIMVPKSFADSGDEDDKYGKYDKSSKRTPEVFQKYHSAFAFLEFLGKQYPMIFGFMCFVFCSGWAYHAVGRPINGDQIGRFISSNSEILGLLLLRQKIRSRQSVAGISGMTIIMYAVVYAQRIGLSLPGSWNFKWKDFDFDASFGTISLILTIDILRSVLFTHRSTYQSDLDVLKAQYILPGCYFVALFVRPHFTGWTQQYGYWWSSCLYCDVLALMPQVVMMARGSGKVEAPIAHFVAATFLSRVDDLWDSLVYETRLRANNSHAYWMVVFLQSIHLLLVADFMYYWLKARSQLCNPKAHAQDITLVEV